MTSSDRKGGVADVVVDVTGRPAAFATRGEHAWRAAVAAAVGTREVPGGVRFEVAVEFRLPAPATANDAWDLDNLVKPTLDALGGVIGWSRRGGVPQADDERIDRLVASKRPAGEDELGASLRIVALASQQG